VIAVRHRVPNDPKTDVVRTRPLCAWPKVAIYRGQGDTENADHFTCGIATQVLLR
jgi:hypothetical protein